MTALPTISLVFVNYRSVWELALALESLFCQERDTVSYEVLVVNNDVTEERALLALAKQCSFRVIPSPENEGFGAGVNRGGREARGAIIGILNPDVRFVEPLFQEMQAVLEKNPTLLCAPTLLTPEGSAEEYSFGPAPSLWGIVTHHSGLVQQGGELDWMSGAALFLTKEHFFALRGFDTKYFLYFEDVDFCLRAKEMGSSLLRLTRTLVHTGGKSFPSRKRQKGYYYTSQQRYFRQYRPKGEAIFLECCHRIAGIDL